MSITKTGIISASAGSPHYLINNFTETNTTTGWSLSNWALTNGVLVGTGTGPNFSTASFTVGANDIVCVEFTVSLPTPSTTTGGPGIYIGTQYGQSVYVCGYNFSSGVWSVPSSTTTNPYFLSAYNAAVVNCVRTYVFGSSVSTATMNLYTAARSNENYGIAGVKLSSGLTTTYLRSGYNSNTSMVINLSNVKVYNVLNCGMCESGSVAKIGKGYCLASELIED